MKNILLISILITAFLYSCKPKKVEPMKIRYIGYIFNLNDSLPFKNTQFKVYRYTTTNGKTEEHFFTTDAKGSFDVTTEIGGQLVWPSFVDGAAYTGPPYFGNPKSENVDNSARISTAIYDTLYTTPYY